MWPKSKNFTVTGSRQLAVSQTFSAAKLVLGDFYKAVAFIFLKK